MTRGEVGFGDFSKRVADDDEVERGGVLARPWRGHIGVLRLDRRAKSAVLHQRRREIQEQRAAVKERDLGDAWPYGRRGAGGRAKAAPDVEHPLGGEFGALLVQPSERRHDSGVGRGHARRRIGQGVRLVTNGFAGRPMGSIALRQLPGSVAQHPLCAALKPRLDGRRKRRRKLWGGQAHRLWARGGLGFELSSMQLALRVEEPQFKGDE